MSYFLSLSLQISTLLILFSNFRFVDFFHCYMSVDIDANDRCNLSLIYFHFYFIYLFIFRLILNIPQVFELLHLRNIQYCRVIFFLLLFPFFFFTVSISFVGYKSVCIVFYFLVWWCCETLPPHPPTLSQSSNHVFFLAGRWSTSGWGGNAHFFTYTQKYDRGRQEKIEG